MKWILVTAALGTSSFGAAAMDVRTATEGEIARSLVGCWQRESTFAERKAPSWGIPYTVTACFEADGVVSTGWVGGDEGIGDAGTYEVSAGKLQLRGPGPSDGWTFDANDLDCDVLMSLGRAMRLLNCVGLGEDADTAIPDSSYGLQVRD
ncbi:hypothetical protein [Devosia sp. A16]|uniref:hypothetical protein n=1 Tax=Devosia sp. A16 TaxID=1736675 RepID=UPI0012E0C9D6|nr:hypothetical protein [Devosia sp. A16]